MSSPIVEVDLRTTVHERVRGILRNDILSGVLKPGAHLRQSALAAELQVSVAPVREALRDLAAEGFVRFDPRRGASVRRVDLEEFREVRALLEAVEPLVATRAVQHITPEEIVELVRLQEGLEQSADLARTAELEVAFHAVLVRSTHAPRLTALVESLDGLSTLVAAVLGEGFPEVAVHEHRPILDALRARDADRLTAASLAHRRPVWDGIEAEIRGRP